MLDSKGYEYDYESDKGSVGGEEIKV